MIDHAAAIPAWLQTAFVACLGAIWGSFFNVVIHRLPREETIGGRSRCPACGAKIPWFHNLPVLSFLWLRARCASCSSRISVQYPLVELVTAMLFVWLFRQYGPTVKGLAYCIFYSILLIISVIDLHHRIIPDELSLGGLVLGIVFSFFALDIAWWESILGVLIGGGSFLLVAIVYDKIAKREGLGGGDIKLLGMIGAWLGFKSIVLVVLISSALGSVVGVTWMLVSRKDLKAAIPFGPFLAAAAFVFGFFGDRLTFLMYPSLP